MPRPPAEPACSARDGRRHAACRSLRQNLSFLAASGAPLVRSRVNAACSLTSDPLGRPHPGSRSFPPPTRGQSRRVLFHRDAHISPRNPQTRRTDAQDGQSTSTRLEPSDDHYRSHGRGLSGRQVDTSIHSPNDSCRWVVSKVCCNSWRRSRLTYLPTGSSRPGHAS